MKKKPTPPTASPLGDSCALFLRVSTVEQETARQAADLAKYAAARGWTVVGTWSEKISGTARNADREGLQAVLAAARAGRTRRILVTEVSRLGRSTVEVLRVVEELTALGVAVVAQNIGMSTLNDDGTRNSMAQMMFTLLAEFARMENETRRERQMSGIEQAKRMGVHCGRPKASRETPEQTLAKKPGVTRRVREGRLTVSEIAALEGCTRKFVRKVRDALPAGTLQEALEIKNTGGEPFPFPHPGDYIAE